MMKKKRFSISRFLTKPRRKALAVALVVLCVNLVLARQISHHYTTLFLDEKRQSVKGELELYGDSLTITLNSYFALLEGVHGFVQAENNSPFNHIESTFYDLAIVFHEGTSGIRNFTIAPNGVQAYVYPREGNENVVGHDLLHDERPEVRADVERAIETREIALSGPYELRQGGLGLVARQAVFVDNEFWGLVAMVVDVPPILANAGLSNDTTHLIFALEDENGEVFFGDSKILDEEPIRYEVLLPDGSWTLSAIPRDGWKVSSSKLLLIQFGLVFVSVSLALTTYLLGNRDERLQHNVAEKTRALNQAIFELEERRAYFQKIIAEMPAPMVITDSKGDVEFYNSMFIETFGYTLEDVVTAEEWWLAAYPNEDYRILVQQTWEKAIVEADEKRAKIATQEWDLTCKDGSVRRVEFDMMPLDEGAVIVMNDISERKQMEQKLQESEGRFRTLFEDSNDAYLILDENIFVDCNQATIKMLRANSKEEVLSTHPSQLSPEFQPDGRSSAEKADEMISTALEQGSNRFEWIHRRMDGEDFPVEVLLTPIVVGEKRIIHTVWRDITERKEAEEALKSSHQRLLTLLDSIPADIYVSDLESHEIIFMNDYMRESFGDDKVGRVCFEVFRDESEQCSICPYDHLLDENGNPTEKFVWEGQNPISKKWYVNYDRATPWSDGRLVHVQIAVDITERKEAEEALKKLNEELDERVEKRTQELEKMLSLMSGREVRMAELKTVITQLRTQLKNAGITPEAHDPLLGPDKEW